jgi:hypothetical protein
MKWISVAGVALVTFVMTLAKPELLGINKFIDQLVSHELVAILVVILTVTMASVANIHLALGRLNKSLRVNNINIDGKIADARTELSENAWYLFYSFIILIGVLIAKGWASTVFWVSACHSVALIILALNMAILYDIYISVYMLTSLDEPPHPGQSGEDGSQVGGNHE